MTSASEFIAADGVRSDSLHCLSLRRGVVSSVGEIMDELEEFKCTDL